jgi:site-specific DNA-cytosine methylase
VGQASSEVEAAALSVASRAFRTQWPSTTHLELGDVRCLSEEYLAALARDCELDLLIGGSPCQDLSRMAVRLLGAFPVDIAAAVPAERIAVWSRDRSGSG